MHYAVKFQELERHHGKRSLPYRNMVNYPVGDFLIRIKNAALANHKELSVSATNEIFEIAKVLKEIGFLEEVKNQKGKVLVSLTFRKKEPVILGINLVSKPGLRIYMGTREIERIKNPFTLLISTPKGILTSKEAIKRRVGGEVIAEIW